MPYQRKKVGCSGKRKISEWVVEKGPGPSYKSSRTSATLGNSGRGTGLSKRGTISKKKGLSRKAR